MEPPAKRQRAAVEGEPPGPRLLAPVLLSGRELNAGTWRHFRGEGYTLAAHGALVDTAKKWDALPPGTTVHAVAQRMCHCAVTICLASDTQTKQECFMALLSDPAVRRTASLDRLQRRACRSVEACSAAQLVAAVSAALRELEAVVRCDPIRKLCLFSSEGDPVLAFREEGGAMIVLLANMEATYVVAQESGRPIWRAVDVQWTTGKFSRCAELRERVRESRTGGSSGSVQSSMVSGRAGLNYVEGEPATHGIARPDLGAFERALMTQVATQPELGGAIQTSNRETERNGYRLVRFLLSVHWDAMET